MKTLEPNAFGHYYYVERFITKFQVIKAVLTERLAATQWVEQDNLAAIGRCSVCAVGAVLRQQGVRNIDISSAANAIVCGNALENEQGIQRLLEREDYLSALSSFFELQQSEEGRYGARSVTLRDRLNLVRFVMKNFPRRFEVSLKVGRVRSASIDD